MALMIIQLLVVLGALYVGSRYGSLALGAISGIGLAILVFGFSMKPGSPPTDVIYIIIAAVTCAGMMQASGGMDWLIQIAERMSQASRSNNFLCSFNFFFPDCVSGNRPCGLYVDAYYLRYCFKERHPSRTSLWSGFYRLSGGYYLLANCSCCSSLHYYLGCKWF